MSTKFQIAALVVALGLVAGACGEQANPTAASESGLNGPSFAARGPVLHKVSVGSNDACAALGAPPGCDGNYSLTATQWADGSVAGQWQDSFGGGNGGLHMTVDCMVVEGNKALVGGVVTKAPAGYPQIVGTRAITMVVDNGTSANDPADQISPSFVGLDETRTCDTFSIGGNIAGYLNDLFTGQVTVR